MLYFNLNTTAVTTSTKTLLTLPAFTNFTTVTNTYALPTVPPSANAPYLHKSSLPGNFIFILAGAILVFCSLVILTWRLLMKCCMEHSIRRANKEMKVNYHRLTELASYPPQSSDSGATRKSWVPGMGVQVGMGNGNGFGTGIGTGLSGDRRPNSMNLDPGDAFRNSTFDSNRFYSPTVQAARLSYGNENVGYPKYR